MEKLNKSNIFFYLINYETLKYLTTLGFYYEENKDNSYLSEKDRDKLSALHKKEPNKYKAILLSNILGNLMLPSFLRKKGCFYNHSFWDSDVTLKSLLVNAVISKEEYRALRRKDIGVFENVLKSIKRNLGSICEGCTRCCNCDDIDMITSKEVVLKEYRLSDGAGIWLPDSDLNWFSDDIVEEVPYPKACLERQKEVAKKLVKYGEGQFFDYETYFEDIKNGLI